jgi:soluble lytic murein transglycosylase-like protein
MTPARAFVAAAVALVGAVSVASPARADIVVLASGRTLSVRSHYFEGGQIVMELRGGGEIACDRSLIDRVEPDEVPYPEPEAEAEVMPAVPAPLSGPYREVIAAAAERHGIEPILLESVIRVESNFARRARSRKGAKGLMQLMPRTARQYGLADPYDPAGNVDAGARHLRTLLDRFELPVALAAYNAGEGAVKRYGGVPPYRETRDYVARILSLVRRPPADAN